MKSIYLAGLISTNYSESLTWRDDAESMLWRDFNVLSPLRGKQNLEKETKDGGVTSETHTPKDIIIRDYNDVCQADIILFNLDSFGSPRPLLGTIYELAWAWDKRKRSIAICAEDNYLMRNHPFVKETISHYFPTLEEACKFIREQQ